MNSPQPKFHAIRQLISFFKIELIYRVIAGAPGFMI
jgi:hypothetical protein